MWLILMHNCTVKYTHIVYRTEIVRGHTWNPAVYSLFTKTTGSGQAKEQNKPTNDPMVTQ